MVKAIQETFQQEESSSSILEKSDNPDKAQNLPSDGAENSAQSVMPDSNSYTIVHVTENFQVRIHLGKVTDVPAHAIVLRMSTSHQKMILLWKFLKSYLIGNQNLLIRKRIMGIYLLRVFMEIHHGSLSSML